jgi:hypothetical protein
MNYLLPFLLVASHLFAQTNLVEKIVKLRPSTEWKQISTIPLHFPTFHPQGIVKIGEFYFMSSVEVTRKRRDTNDGGEGVGHLFKFDSSGKLLEQITLGEGGIFHPGGIDFDGHYIWVPVAEYRPNSKSIIYRVSPKTLKVEEVMRFNDHIGAIVHANSSKTLSGVSWGSRHFYHWGLDARGNVQKPVPKPEQIRIPNASFYIDYQDCHSVGKQLMLCGGLQKYRQPDGTSFTLGGLELVNLGDNRPVFQVPLLIWSPTGNAMTNNPFFIESIPQGLRAYFVPDDDAASTLFVYEAVLK